MLIQERKVSEVKKGKRFGKQLKNCYRENVFCSFEQSENFCKWKFAALYEFFFQMNPKKISTLYFAPAAVAAISLLAQSVARSFKRSTTDEKSLTLKQFLFRLVVQFLCSQCFSIRGKFSHKFSTTYPNVCKSVKIFYVCFEWMSVEKNVAWKGLQKVYQISIHEKLQKHFHKRQLPRHQMLVNSLSPLSSLLWFTDDRNGHKNWNPESSFNAGDRQ